MDVPKAKIHIVGTSHIATRSAQEIERAYAALEPDIVCVELDKRRLKSLEERKGGDQRIPLSMMRQVGVTGYLFIVVGRYVQKKLGGIVKVEPGVDMLKAVELARKDQKKLFLIDQDIMKTTRNLSDQFTFREKMRVIWDIISSPFNRKLKKINFSLDRVPDEKTLKTLMNLLKERYPSLYNVLIIERNIVMARNLDQIVRKNPGKDILLVIGKGHEEDLRARLKMMEGIATIL
jgi:pheromone shutdown protein TraB